MSDEIAFCPVINLRLCLEILPCKRVPVTMPQRLDCFYQFLFRIIHTNIPAILDERMESSRSRTLLSAPVPVHPARSRYRDSSFPGIPPGVLEVLRYTGEASRRPSRIPAQTSEKSACPETPKSVIPIRYAASTISAAYSFRRRTWCGCENPYEASVISFLISLCQNGSASSQLRANILADLSSTKFIANSAPPSASAFQTARKVLLSIIRKQIEQFHNQQIAPFFALGCRSGTVFLLYLLFLRRSDA